MYSVRRLARCQRDGRAGGDASSTQDESLRALVLPASPASLLVAMRIATAPTLDVNLLWVSLVLPTLFGEMVRCALDEVREILDPTDINLGRVRESTLPIEAAGFAHIADHDESLELTQRFTGPSGGIDVFLVATYATATVGFSAINGTCQKAHAERRSGVVVALEGDEELTAHTIAHELGHYLGLTHIGDEDNLMFRTVPNGAELTAQQAATMRRHCAIRTGCSIG